MKMRVHAVSNPAWQPVKNGQPYNKWTATIQLTNPHKILFGFRYYLVIADKDKEKVEKRLSDFLVGQIVSVPRNRLIMPQGVQK